MNALQLAMKHSEELLSSNFWVKLNISEVGVVMDFGLSDENNNHLDGNTRLYFVENGEPSWIELIGMLN